MVKVDLGILVLNSKVRRVLLGLERNIILGRDRLPEMNRIEIRPCPEYG